MSLTSRLRDAESPVREYLNQISPRLQATEGNRAAPREAVELLGFASLVNSARIVAPFPGTDLALIGTAVDFRARIELGGFEPQHSAAAAGIALLRGLAPSIENGHHRARILTEAFAVAESLLRDPAETSLDRAAVLLAYFEQVYRAGTKSLSGSLGRDCDEVVDGAAFAERIDSLTLADLRSLMAANSAQLETWGDQIAGGDRFDPNPAFSGSSLVDGADADWLIGETLIDCKVFAAPTATSMRDALRQLLGYVMLDMDDALHIRRIGIWLPRQGLMPTWSLARLLGGDPDEMLPSLRQGFERAAADSQVAHQSPIPVERLHKRLADNRHTPYDMMADLGLSDDPGVRRRIGRNAVAPEATVRLLAKDRRWEVREGVATNEAAPDDVLEMLSRDPSVAVRRAVAANPGSPQPLMKALAKDLDAGVKWTAQANTGTAMKLAISNAADPEELRVSGIARTKRPHDGLTFDPAWLSKFIEFAEGTSSSLFGIPLPVPSLRWAVQAKRPLDGMGWMRKTLPVEVIEEFFHPEQPSWLRRWASRHVSVADPAMRERLLKDADADIRWTTLQRTIESTGDALEALLAELAASPESRLQFRTAGTGARREWRRTAAEYDRETLCFIASHPSTPQAALAVLMSSSSSELKANLIENPSLHLEDRLALVQSMKDGGSVSARELLASLSAVPEETLAELASDKYVRVRIAVAANSTAPSGTLFHLAADRERSVRIAVLGNPATPAGTATEIAHEMLLVDSDEELLQTLDLTKRRAEIILPTELVEAALDRLSKSRVRDPDIRVVAANDDRSTIRTLTRLSRSVDSRVRDAVAANPGTPSVVLEQLANDPDQDVRAAVAFHPHSPPAALAALAMDESSRVRAIAATHPNLSRSSLDALLLDPDPNVRNAALKNPLTPDEVVVEAEAERDAQRPRPDREALERMVASKHAEVRMEAAFAPTAGPDLLAILGGERASVRVRRVVAANPNSEPAVLRSLASDSDSQILQALAFNGSTPPVLLRELAGRSIDLAILVAMNPDAGDLIDDLAKDSSPLVRFAAAGARAERAISGSDDASAPRAVTDDARRSGASGE